MQKTWFVQQAPEITEISRLQEELKIPPIIAQLLLQRGITTFEEARSFFRPSLNELHDPFLMKGMQNAVDCLKKIKSSNAKILVFGDYDVDGTTAVALMSLFLEEHGFNFDFYIPDRYKEGYGVSEAGIDYAKNNDCQLIIALDCGITAVDKVQYAKKLGIDFIICDHHLPGEKIPEAIVLNPKQKDCNYPYEELSGCGIGFKLAQAYVKATNGAKSFLSHLLDLVAIAIAADIVPVTGENRILAYFGLKQINENKKRLGIAKMLKLAKKEITLTLTDLVFVIAPRINAAGRIASGKLAVELLLCEDDKKSQEFSDQIELLNSQRRAIETEITQTILSDVEQIDGFENKKTTVVCGEDWHKGVVGIVASRIMEKYYRPTIVLSLNNNIATGSVRSVSGFNVYEALKKCQSLLIQFGGHAMAAGVTLEKDKISAFQEKFEEVVAASIQKEQLVRKATVDALIGFNEIFTSEENPNQIPKIKRILAQFEPTGPENMKPVFMAKNVFIDETTSRIVGDEHYKLSLFQPNCSYKINGIGFNLGYKQKELDIDAPVDVVFTMEENTWNNKTNLQLNVKDIRKT